MSGFDMSEAAPETTGNTPASPRPWGQALVVAQFLALSLALATVPAPPAFADQEAASDLPLAAGDADAAFPALHLGGFATLGLARSSSDDAEFVRDLSQPGGIGPRWSAKIDSVLGVQGNLHLSPSIETIVQALSRYGPEGDFRPELSLAFVSLAPSPAIVLRAGRIGTDFYMLADSRWVGYSYLTVRPPNDYFGALPFYAIDGADATLTRPLGQGLARAKLFSGLSREKAPLGERLWDLDDSRITGANLGYQSGSWQWRVGHAKIRFQHELPADDLFAALAAFAASGFPSAADAARSLAVAGTTSRFSSIGLLVDHGPLQTHLMLNRTRHESSAFQNSRAGYVIVGYRLGRHTPFAGFSRVASTPKAVATGIPEDTGNPGFDQSARTLNAAVAAALADSHSDQHTITLGTRVDLRDSVALKAQWDAIRGQPDSIFPYRREAANWSGRTDVVTFTLDVVF